MSIGFIGIGVMGFPMAMNLLAAGHELVVWNRTRDKCAPLQAAGATVAASAGQLFQDTRIVILMMRDSPSMDAVLARGEPEFVSRVRGRLVVSMGTFTPAYSRSLGDAIRAAGGSYVEAPVSGSRQPAEAGRLVAMVAGLPQDVDAVVPILQAMCSLIVPCGSVPLALTMKLAVNVFLITTVTGLSEAAHFAKANNLDLRTLQTILDAGPMASSVSRIKLEKLVTGDFSVQASIPDVLKNSRLITALAHHNGIATPMLDLCESLYAQALDLGHAEADMAAVVRSFEARTAELRTPR